MTCTRRSVGARVVLFALAACLAALGIGAFAASASALTLPFHNWAVWGTLTDKKLNEAITLPKDSTFNGEGDITKFTATELEGTLHGKLHVPPFKATVKLGGEVPVEVGLTLTEVGESHGTLTPAPPSTPACVNARFAGICTETKVTSKAIVGITGTGLGGIELPAECQTSEPVTLELSTISSANEITAFGAHFTGETTIPSITCGGLDGVLLGPIITELMSGPENPYSLHLAETEPAAPAIEVAQALGVTQLSARLRSVVNPEHEPLTECRFEYGTSTSYGTSVPCTSHPGEGYVEKATITGLEEGKAYDYRVVAANSLGSTDGANETFSTLGSSGAPEYGQCVEQKGGEYAESTCQEKAKKAGHGKYEWKPGPAPTCVAKKKGEYTESSCKTKAAKPHKGSFETAPGAGFTATTGAVTLETDGLGTVTCAAGTATGQVTTANGGSERISLTGCEMAGKKCTSEGANGTPSGTPGTIETNLLHTRLLGPVEHQVWTELTSAEHAPYVAEFGCEGPRLRTSGSAAGVQSGDVLKAGTASMTLFEAEHGETPTGEQALATALSENGGESFGEAKPSTFGAEFANTSASAVEIRP